MSLVLQEIRNLRADVRGLSDRLDKKHGELEERLREAELALARITTKISVGVAAAGVLGATLALAVRAYFRLH